MTTLDLRSEYVALQPLLIRLQKEVAAQLGHLVETSGLTLGVPIESRVKTWDSLDEKLKRKGAKPLSSFEDLLGLRVIFLFQKDLESFVSSIDGAFIVHSKEDTSSRLKEDRFGYKSTHYIVSAPEAWSAVPTMSGLSGLKVEIQVRTLSQHIWAMASHKLQYKQEGSVPKPIQRSINRVSALLELVDLELARVLDEKEDYAIAKASDPQPDDVLDVSVIEAVLDNELPPENKDEFAESYAELQTELSAFGITTRAQLEQVLRTQKNAVLEEESRYRESGYDEDDLDDPSKAARATRGVYFTHIGLARHALHEQFGDAYENWRRANPAH